MKVIEIIIDYKKFKYFSSISKAAKYLNCSKSFLSKSCKSFFEEDDMKRRIRNAIEVCDENKLSDHVVIKLVNKEIPIYRLDDGEFNPICVWVKCYNKDKNNKGFEQPFFFKTKSDAAKYFGINRQEFSYISKNIKDNNKNGKYSKLYKAILRVEVVDKSHELWNEINSNDIISYTKLESKNNQSKNL